MYFECVWLLYRRFFDCFSVICNKTFYKVYTLFSHTHLTTLSQLLAVGGVTTCISKTASDVTEARRLDQEAVLLYYQLLPVITVSEIHIARSQMTGTDFSCVGGGR